MEIIAVEQIRKYLQLNLNFYKNPCLFISSRYFSGCKQCHSDTSIYTVDLIEESSLNEKDNLIKVLKHKFPFPVFFKSKNSENLPTKIWIGTEGINNQLKIKVKRFE